MKEKIRNVSYTLSANILNFLLGFVTSFLIPKFMGIDDYAYLKMFAFYTTYIGLTHFGFLDGIYIKYGSYDYERLPRKKFRAYFKFLLIGQIIESIVISILIFSFVSDTNRKILFVFVIMNMLIINTTTLFSFIHQITKRFKLFSINLILSKLLYVIGCLGLLYGSITEYKKFILLQTLVNIIILVIYIIKNKNLVFGHSEKILENIPEYINMVKIGMLVMIGNFITIVILGIDRLFVDSFFGLEEFAIYSFAYSLISLFYIFSNSVSTVIYPFLTRMKEDEYKKIYETFRTCITLLMGLSLSGYFLIKFVVSNYLPKYISSLKILIFLVPTVMYSTQINVLIANFYKMLKETKEYSKNNLYSLLLSVILNIVAVIMVKSIEGIAIATLISFIIWLLYSEFYFKKILDINILKNTILDTCILINFFITVNISNWVLAILVYLALFIFILAIYKKEIIKVKNYIFNKSTI